MVDLYPNIPHDGLAVIKDALDKRTDKAMLTGSLMHLAEFALINIILISSMIFPT